MKEKSWACTIVTQFSLCMLVYIAIDNIGQTQKFTHPNISSQGSKQQNAIYFISVVGGFMPPQEQILLLQQMVKVEKIYKPRFVVVFSELGESDPILQNATLLPGLKNVPWYLSGASKGEGETYFSQKIEIPHGKTLDVIALDTVLLQDRSIARGNDQVMWLKRIITESNSDWKIVVGYHQLISLGHNVEKENDTHFEPLQDILVLYGVDVYMSMKTSDETAKKATYLTPMNDNLASEEETGGGFLLHRISSLEMVTLAVKLSGEIEHRSSFQPRGRAAM